jgi:hypothetical protein
MLEQNECNTYTLLGTNHPTVEALKRKFQSVFGISLPFIMNIIPKRTKITVVVGEPLHVPKIDSPSHEEVYICLRIVLCFLLSFVFADSKTGCQVP